nr:hypothetical protein [Mycobacteroides chelonae]
MAKKKPAAEPDAGSIARPPWLPPPEKERRWSLSGLGGKKKDQGEPAGDREAPQVVDLDDDDDQVVEPSAADVPEATTVEDVEADVVVAPADFDEPVSQSRRTVTDDSIAVPSVSEPVDNPWEMKVPAWGEVSESPVSPSALDRADDIEISSDGDEATVVPPISEPVVPVQADTPWEMKLPAWGEVSEAAASSPVPDRVDDIEVPAIGADVFEDRPETAEVDSVRTGDAVAESGFEFAEPEPVLGRVDMPWESEVPEVSLEVEAAPAPVEDVVPAWQPPAPLVEPESIDSEPVAVEAESSADTPELDEPVGVSTGDAVVESELSGQDDVPWESEVPEVSEVSSEVDAAPAPVEDVVPAWQPPAPLAEPELSASEPVAAEAESSTDTPELDEVEMRAAALLDAVARARESAAVTGAEPIAGADDFSQLDEQPAHVADSDVPEVDPSGDVPAVDEIDQRAAALLAAMEAKRSQPAASEADSAEQAPVPASEPEQDDEPAPDLSLSVPTELDEAHDLPAPRDLDSGAAESDDPFEADANSASESDPVAQDLSEHHETAQGYPETIDEDIPDVGVEHLDEDVQSPRPPTRRLALPPWQLPGAATSVEFERFGPHKPSSYDDEGPFPRLRRDHDKRDHADKPTPQKPPAEPLNESPAGPVTRDAPQPPMQDPRLSPPPLPPGWKQRLPPPPPGWRPPQPPPPGWRPRSFHPLHLAGWPINRVRMPVIPGLPGRRRSRHTEQRRRRIIAPRKPFECPRR